MEKHILTLIFITLGIFVIPFIAPIVRLPVAVGELIYGVFLFYFLKKIHLFEETFQLIDFLSFLGFSLLMFLAGLEIDWNKLEVLERKEKVVISAVVVSNFLISFLVALALNLPLETVLLFGSLGIGLMLSVVREMEIPPKVLQTILITGSLGEITTLLGLTLYDLYLSFGFGKKFFTYIGLIVLFGVFFVFLLKFLKLLVWYFPEKIAALIEGENKAAVDIRAIFALMLTFMAFTSILHIEPILGAFIAGVLFGFIFREKESVEHKLTAFGYGFLIPFFFIQVGFSFQPSYLTDVAILKTAFLFLVILFGVKLVSSLWLFFLGFSLRQVIMSAFLFSFPFTILIAVAKILYEKGVWNDFQLASTILLTVISAIIFPPFSKVFLKEERENP